MHPERADRCLATEPPQQDTLVRNLQNTLVELQQTKILDRARLNTT